MKERAGFLSFPINRQSRKGTRTWGISESLRGWDEQAPTGAEWRSLRPRFYVAEQGVRTARRWIDYLDDYDADTATNTRPMNYPVQGGAAGHAPGHAAFI